MSSSAHGTTPYYFVPGPSRHPAMAAFGLLFVVLGASQWINGADWGKYALAFGLAFELPVRIPSSRFSVQTLLKKKFPWAVLSSARAPSPIPRRLPEQ